jgi:aldose 1-epimerase
VWTATCKGSAPAFLNAPHCPDISGEGDSMALSIVREYLSLPVLTLICAMAVAAPARAASSITVIPWGNTSDGATQMFAPGTLPPNTGGSPPPVPGELVEKYTLSNGVASVSIITYGGIVTNLMMPDRNGNLGDVVLGFDNLQQYETRSPYFGALVGRTCNRIAKGMFSIDGTRYCTPVNNGPNSLHGGFKGYDKRVWAAEPGMTPDGPSLRLTLTDPDGEEGFPGTVKVTVIYSLTSDSDTGGNGLKIQYYATTDKPTPINLTNHSYFNLKDGGASDVLGHVLTVYGDYYTPVDSTLIPTGEIAPVKGTPIDFTSPKPIGQDLMAMGGKPAGYDHNIVLRSQDGSLAHAATVLEPTTGRVLDVWTTQPGVQLYTSNFLDGSVKGKGGLAYQSHSAFCLETQHYPDSVNQPKFPNSMLHPGETYREITEFLFTTAK